MALFVNRTQQKTQFQEKLDADLKNKLNSAVIKAETTDPALLEDAHRTRPAGMLIAILLFVLVAAIVVYALVTR